MATPGEVRLMSMPTTMTFWTVNHSRNNGTRSTEHFHLVVVVWVLFFLFFFVNVKEVVVLDGEDEVVEGGFFRFREGGAGDFGRWDGLRSGFIPTTDPGTKVFEPVDKEGKAVEGSFGRAIPHFF